MEGEITLSKRETEFADVEEGMDKQGWGGGGWEEKELHQRGRDFATEADMGRLLRRAGRRCSTQTWKKSAFLENHKEMVWSLLLLNATLIITKPLFLFAFLFAVHVSIGYLYLQHCRVVGPAQWEKFCGTLRVLSEKTQQR